MMEITDPVLMFSFIMFLLLIAPIISRKFKIPEIVGLILAGIFVGPHGLGILRPEGSIALFASVGLIYIMFLAGLEINTHEFNRQKQYSILFGSLTFGIPMLLGTLGAKALFQFSWPTALLLASMFASHTLISFPATVQLGISRERSVVAAVGGTIITDTAAMLVLAIIAEYASASLSAAFWTRQLFLLCGLVIFSLWLLPKIAQFFLRILSPEDKAEFIFVLALVFLTAYLAHLANVEPIIGAFLAGLALSRMISEQSPLMNRLEFIGNALFIPFFLISVGMLVNLRVLAAGWKVWAVALFMVSAVIACKYAASMLFARLAKFSKDEGRLIFGLSINQAAATLAAVIVGLRLGIFDESILNGTILMILITCIVGPVYTEKYGKKIALGHIKPPDHIQHGDERVMVGVSRAESVEFLTDIALKLRPKDSQEPLFPLYVVQDGENLDQRVAAGEKLLGKIVTRAVAANIPVSPINRIDVNIPGGILHALHEWHIDTFVMGASRYESSFKTMLFGVHEKISQESRQLIFLCQITHDLSIDKKMFFILPPIAELHAGFYRAVEATLKLAANNKLQAHIVATPETITHLKAAFKKELATADVVWVSLSQTKEFSQYLKDIRVQSSDAIAFFSPRRGQIGSRPSIERLYYQLCHQFPKNNIFLVHPSDLQNTSKSLTPNDTRLSENIRNHPFLSSPATDIHAQNPQQAVETLLASYFGAQPRMIAQLIKDFLPLDPLELTPEILLLHTHTDNIDQPIVLLGINHGDFVFPPLNKKTSAFFLLISPRTETSLHLQTLAKIARIAKEFHGSNHRS